MNNITVNMDNLSTDERNTLLKLIEKANKLKSKVWKPESNERYYALTSFGNICKSKNSSKIDDKCYEIGNCFKTEEEAKFALEKQKVITELKRFALENNECELDWKDYGQKKYCIEYDCANDCFINNKYRFRVKGSDIYFSSENIAKQAIETIGEDRLKKYYFEVNDNE